MIIEKKNIYNEFVVVLLVMGKVINSLIKMVKDIIKYLNKCDVDLFILIGEIVLIVLFFIMLNDMGYKLIVLIGEKVGILIKGIYIKNKILSIDIRCVEVYI